ncbi:hypothetical protein MNB_SUP05-SYMBIONT-7-46 [hydrothermal vent metagenome]|uniref:Uncharacterized protein n=1 Tax=hydrothermal vent metagenome TaxID=652676 RepID=A0A1W1E5N9_9ZZZZ
MVFYVGKTIFLVLVVSTFGFGYYFYFYFCQRFWGGLSLRDLTTSRLSPVLVAMVLSSNRSNTIYKN